ncbi:MAG: hypothetical protein IPI85_05090 [Dehalococcoidia bacterium]|nr:hypothetical protein [Dehalococcoidia bacterium]
MSGVRIFTACLRILCPAVSVGLRRRVTVVSMALSRPAAIGLRLPEDLGLGLAVTALVAGVTLLVCASAAASPGPGPRSESRLPDGTVYVDIQPAAIATAPGR